MHALAHLLCPNLQEAITKAFSQTSRDGSGLLRTNELQVAMRSLGFDMSKDRASHLVETSQNAREGGAGGINFDQFLELIEAAAIEAAAHKDLSNTFQLFKEEKQLFASSRITLEDLRRVRDQTMPHVTNQQVEDMYRVAKSDNVAGIDIDEFCAVLNKKGYFIPPHDH
ncbi:hypothetical protein DUNSADRAFT_5459 [Dunaliella salina]|uniref:EF-hand domain-containing protein n=1 Tax=Dunaliella salina TaxID=3046 RepID=A0ABQ7GQ80_DUNSA|nr:hypothetical protein DUNSADRAFT_5459 [Dunaliella salina]|eukprot:KAF5836769.1 hypothetical protein DUNSADRAFT_5459 [Dunaliella salina]